MKKPEVDFRLIFNQFKFKQHCLLCQSPGSYPNLICSGCHNDLPWLHGCCHSCAEPLTCKRTLPDTTVVLCGQCLKKPPHFDLTRSPLRYDFPVDQLINRLKHQAKPDLIQLFSDLFYHRFQHSIYQNPPQCLIPVPLHPYRLFGRGYNQAAEWGRCLSKQLEIPLNSKLCRRVSNTPHQQGLTAKARRRNLANAYLVGNCDELDHVAIVDDVVTTGTTVDLLAKQLKRQGVKKVEVWSIARTPSLRHSH